MSSELPFPHHNYLQDPDDGAFELVPAEDASACRDPTSADLPDVRRRLRMANVAEIVLIHGTFAGNDIIGLVREVARLSPKLASSLNALGKQVLDRIAGEIGNYNDAFANVCDGLVNSGQANAIKVTRFSWSGENHHLGRAAGAVALLDHIHSRAWDPNQRILFFGHSHGGNLLAMMSWLLGCNRSSKQAFFSATRLHYCNPLSRRIDLPQWEKVHDQLMNEALSANLPALDVVTFGTPLRYRWNTDVCSRLLHFVHHRPLMPDHPSLAKIPSSVQEVFQAVGGDYVQQLGIGGTDFLHYALAWRSWSSERRLRRMFAAHIRRRDLAKSLRRCLRVSRDGITLLVDYPDTPEKHFQQLIGHGIYTRSEWLPFHLQSIATRFY